MVSLDEQTLEDARSILRSFSIDGKYIDSVIRAIEDKGAEWTRRKLEIYQGQIDRGERRVDPIHGSKYTLVHDLREARMCLVDEHPA